MKKYGVLAVFVLNLVLSTSPLYAQVQFGGQVNYGTDTDFGVGARVALGLEQLLEGLEITGAFDWFFPDLENDDEDVDYTYFEVNGNVLYKLSLQQTTAFIPYLGAGVNVAHGSLDSEILGNDEVEISDTEVGMNVLGGMKVKLTEDVQPFIECRFEIGGGKQFVVTGGLLF
jgi:opacity protein-like surface antigen